MKPMLFLVLFCSPAPYQNIAVIDGRDPCEYACIINCPCACGDLYFHFTDTSFTDNIPIDNQEIFKFPPNTTYPVKVKVNWINTTRCGVFAIRITGYQIL
jgi:hypothetical protein